MTDTPTGRAERAWEGRPFATIETLHKAMTGQVERASREEQLALLRALPDLGARVRMSGASTGEQSAAGLDRLSAAETQRLDALNREYREKFSFPFLFAIKGSAPRDILQALETRLPREHGEEVVFLHRLQPGKASKSYGISVARLAGLPWPVIERAREVLARLERYELAVFGGDPKTGVAAAAARCAASQMALFPAVDDPIEHLRNVDVDSLSPGESVEVLRELKKSIN